jgi:CDP-diacylglycerol---serine O-phosphatidyltransferase
MKNNWIPNLLTSLNLFAGILAIMLIITSHVYWAAGLIWGAILFDGADGRVARRLNATSDFGKELDSLADLVSFGVAPAMLLYFVAYPHYGWWIYPVIGLFPVAGALRLARFNVQNIKGYFVGLPIPAAGGLLTVVALLSERLPEIVPIMALLCLAGLMVSTIRVPKL